MRAYKKISFVFFIILLFIAAVFTLFSCANDNAGGEESGIFVLSEETFNSEFGTPEEGKFSFSAERVCGIDEDDLINGNRYYALIYIKDTAVARATISFASFNVKLEDKIFVGAGKGSYTAGISESLNSLCTLINEGKAKETDVYVAVSFTVEKLNVSTSTLGIYALIYSEYDYSEDANNRTDSSFEKHFMLIQQKHVSAVSSIKYLTEDDYKSGDYEEKLTNEIGPLAVGEKIYAVIDIGLSKGTMIEETDTLNLNLLVQSTDAKYQLNVEEFPTSDYVQNEEYGGLIDAAFRIYGTEGDGKKYRFIVSVTAEKAGTVSIEVIFSGDGISVIGGSELKGGLEIDSSLAAVSLLEYQLSSDGKYYILTGVGNDRGDVINVPEVHDRLPVREIGDGAFAGISYIKKITLSGSIQKIGANAFKGCTGLKGLIIPSNVKTVEDGAFDGCGEMYVCCVAMSKPSGWSNDFISDKSKVVWSYKNPFKLTDSGYSFSLYGMQVANVVIPESYNGINVTEIAEGAFDSQKTLKSVVIPNTVKYIRSDAFYNCSLLTEIVIPDSVEVIYADAFWGCSSLRRVIIGENSKLRSIGKTAFHGCGELTSITLPRDLKTIGERAFLSCHKLVEVINRSSVKIISGSEENGGIGEDILKIHSGETEIKEKDGYLFYTHGGVNYLISYVGDKTSLTLPDTFNGESYKIYKYAFNEKTDITEIKLGSGVTAIGERAFYGCTSLSEIVIKDGVTNVGNYAFDSCTSLIDVTVGSGVSMLGKSVFNRCTAIKNLSIGKKVEIIDANAFTNCTALEKITVNAENSVYKSVNNCVINKNTGELVLGCKNSLIPNDGSVTEIGEKAFYNCAGLTAIILPDSLIQIDALAFYGCTGLTEINIPSTVTKIGSNAFGGCNAIKELHVADISKWCYITFETANSNPIQYARAVYVNGERIWKLQIPEAVNEISEYAFYGYKGLVSVTLPSTLTAIGNDAFLNCNILVEVINRSTLTVTLNGDGNGSVGKYALLTHSDESKIVNKDGFLFCTVDETNYLLGYVGTTAEITLPNDYEGENYKILNYAFYKYDGVEELTVPDGVTEIGDYAFYEFGGLKKLTFGKKLTAIGDYAFTNCILENVRYKGKKTEWERIKKGACWGMYSTGPADMFGNVTYTSNFSITYNFND